MNTSQAVERQAARDNTSGELLRELEAAHLIIRNAMSVLSVSQKMVVAQRNAREGFGLARSDERAAVIAKAKGGAQQ